MRQKRGRDGANRTEFSGQSIFFYLLKRNNMKQIALIKPVAKLFSRHSVFPATFACTRMLNLERMIKIPGVVWHNFSWE
jgi:hypothetical protein